LGERLAQCEEKHAEEIKSLENKYEADMEEVKNEIEL